jgi:hypothetical protein
MKFKRITAPAALGDDIDVPFISETVGTIVVQVRSRHLAHKS